MKKLMILFALLIFISSVSALSIEHDEVYSQGETVILKIEGIILEPISEANFKFMRGHEAVPVANDVIKIGGDYYLWFITPKNVNNYSVTLEGISTTVAGVPDVVDYSFNITTTEEVVSYNVKPGVIFSSEDFEVEVFLNEDLNKDINVDGDIVTLNPGLNTILISIAKINGTQQTVFNVGSYKVPAYIIGEVNIESGLKFIPDILIDALVVGEGRSYSLELENVGNESVGRVEIQYNNEIFVSDVTVFEDIGPGERGQFDIVLKSGLNESVDSFVRAYYGDESVEINIKVVFVEDIAEIEEVVERVIEDSTKKASEDYSCKDKSGKICESDEKCIGTTETALEGKCCIGRCEKKEESSTLLGIILVLVVIGIGAFIYWKYKKVKRKDPLKVMGR